MLLGTPNSEHLALGKGKAGAGNAPGTTAAWRFSRRLIRCHERGRLCRGAPEPRPAGSQRESMSVGASGIKEKAPVQTRGWMSSARISPAGEDSALPGGFHRRGWGCSSSPWKGLDLRHPRSVFACAHPHVHAATPAHSPPCTLTPTLLPHSPRSPAPHNGQHSLPGRGSSSRTHGRGPEVPTCRPASPRPRSCIRRGHQGCGRVGDGCFGP